MCRDLLASRELAWRLCLRNIRAEYRQSFLGLAWALIPPALTTAGFAFANNAGILNIQETSIPYPAYVILSTTLWQTFLEAFNGPQKAINISRTLLSQVKFPHEAIILSQLGQISFNLVVKLCLLIIVFLIFSVPVSWTALLAPISIASLICLGTSLGLVLIPITNLIKDVSRSIELIIIGWFFLTPVAYPPPSEGVFSVLVKINPVTPLLVTARELITTGEISYLVGFYVTVVGSLIGLLVGWIIFRLSIPFLVERIS
ncbi:MAG: ABC transporter permease [Leptolyngbya sp. SIO3F4]|nr:ABC transporter permease [Leptolyngbya sp. SIO3F4]